MKKLLIALVYLFTSLVSFSQTPKFWYDASGNRTSRKIVMGAKSESGLETDNKKPIETFSDQVGETTILIYPNPAKSQITVEIQGMEENKGNMISIYDQSGRLVRTKTNVSPTNNLDLSDFQTGIYFMIIKLKDGTTKWTIIKE
jgi:Secretion system C-terminal sorting domain